MRVPTCFLGQNIVRHRQVKDNFKTKQNIYVYIREERGGRSSFRVYTVKPLFSRGEFY